jgi:hypothetical protein
LSAGEPRRNSIFASGKFVSDKTEQQNPGNHHIERQKE